MTVGRLITDEDILAGRVSSPIVLDEQTLLTPAARDRAVLRGMVIVERDDVAGRQAAGECPRCGRATGSGGAGAGAAAGAAAGTATGTAAGTAAGAGAGTATTTGTATGTGTATCTARGVDLRGCSRNGSPVLGPLPDGLYLVRVAAGRTVEVHSAVGPGPLSVRR